MLISRCFEELSTKSMNRQFFFPGIGSEPSPDHLAVKNQTPGRPGDKNCIQRRLIEAFGEDHAVHNYS